MRYVVRRFARPALVRCVFGLGLVAGFWLWMAGQSLAAPAEPSLASDDTAKLQAEFNVPEEFLQRVRERALLDAYAASSNALEAEFEAAGYRPTPRQRTQTGFVRIVRASWPESVARYRLGFGESVRPLRGFRAPILDEADQFWPVQWPGAGGEGAKVATFPRKTPEGLVPLPSSGVGATEWRAAELIQRRLAFDGVLVTLAGVLEILGPAGPSTNGWAIVPRLREVGIPVDLLGFFRLGPEDARDAGGIIAFVAGRLVAGHTVEELRPVLQSAAFEFQPTHPGFRAGEETGEHEIGLLRVQIGGGWREGILRGGSIDVTGQLLSAFPEVPMVASIIEEYVNNLEWLALHCWSLHRTNHLTLVAENRPISPWAQDNGKGGYLAGGGAEFGAFATLCPRYASRGELDSEFYPGDSFLMDGLRAAGHRVLHSPLLFQGGNLLLAHDRVRAKQVLLLAETEIYRNMALGLTRSQVLEAFRIEFGVEECVVMPAVSYHLDYDLTLRLHEGKVVAFVNDPEAAARLIVLRAVGALEQGRAMSAQSAAKIREFFGRNELVAALAELEAALRPSRNEKGQYRPALVRLFALGPTEGPAFNFRCFLAARDILASRALTGAHAPAEASAAAYLAALRGLETAAQEQHKRLEELGWQVVAVPSLPDLYRSFNYLNGLQEPKRYLMPAVGGFYAALDQAVAGAFRRVLGDQVEIMRLFTQEIQRQHGGLHCAASAYPRVRQDSHHTAQTDSTKGQRPPLPHHRSGPAG